MLELIILFIQFTDSDEFHTIRSFWYRLFYIVPVFITFRMRIYIGLILSECACIMAGLGAYPTDAEAKPGMGPAKKDYQLHELYVLLVVVRFSFSFCILSHLIFSDHKKR